MAEALGESPGIVVLGAGYGGLRTALTLGRMPATRRGMSVTLVDQGRTHQIITELHRVATGYLSADAVSLPLEPLLEKTGVRFRQAVVKGLDTGERRVLFAEGASLPYRHLVLALGSDV